MAYRSIFQRTLGHSQAQSWNQYLDEGAGDKSKINTKVLDSSSEILFNLSSTRKLLMNNVDRKRKVIHNSIQVCFSLLYLIIAPIVKLIIATQ